MFSKEDLLKLAISEDVKYIRLQFTDMLGYVKNVEIPVNKLEDALDNKIMFDGSSVEGFVRIQEADMYLYPDYNTWLIVGWESSKYGRVARLICDVYTAQGIPFEGDPRGILKRNILKMKELGYSSMNVGFEPEFFLFKLDEKGNPTLEANDDGGYFDLSPIDGAEDCRRDIVLELTKLGFDMEASHHEVAPGQHEINFKFADALEACDNVQTFKIVVKNIAKRYNLHATFMPKPIANINGSGMHTNCSLTTLDGSNAFYDENTSNKLSDTAIKWISGILTYAREFTLITNPTVNSYKRLVTGYEAPCYISWSDANRSTMIRIPATRGIGTRTEVRSVDPSANPYLAVSVILASGLEGIKGNVDIINPIYVNLFDLTDKEREELNVLNLPQSLKEAIVSFKAGNLIKDVIGEHLTNKLLLAKEIEWEEYRKAVTDWEVNRYLRRL